MDYCCAQCARSRNPRWSARTHGGRQFPRIKRRQDRPGRSKWCRQNHPHEDVGRGDGANSGAHRPLRRDRISSAGPALWRPGDACPHPHPRCTRSRHDLTRNARVQPGHGEPRCGGQRGCDAAIWHVDRPVQRLGRVCRRSGSCIDRQQPEATRPHTRPTAKDPFGRPATPHRTCPHPVLGSRDHDPGRAHEPPRRRFSGLAARVRQELPRRMHHHQPRH